MQSPILIAICAIVVLPISGWAQECPHERSWVDTNSSHAEAVAVVGNYAFLGLWGGNLWTIDISDPDNPSFVDNYTSMGSPLDLVVAGDYVYIADYNGFLTIADVSDPGDVQWVAYYDPAGSDYGRAVAVSGDYAYVGGSEGLFEIVDISSPAAPLHVGSIDTLSNPQAIKLANGLAYVADEYEGLKILDVGTPTAPTVIGSFDTIGKARDVHIEGAKAYVADDNGGLRIIDVNAPATPIEVGSWGYAGGNRLWNVDKKTGGILVVTNYWPTAVHVVDVSDPSAPEELGTATIFHSGKDVAIVDWNAFVAGDEGGFHIFSLHPCGGVFADGFESGTTDEWDLAAP